MSDDQQEYNPSPIVLSNEQSVVSTGPIPPPKPMFTALLSLAIEFSVITLEALRKMLPLKDILAMIFTDMERAIIAYKHVLQLDGPLHDKLIARYPVDRMSADITLAAEIDADAADRLRQEITLDVAFFIEHMPLGDIYAAVMANLMKEDSPANRACIARLLEAMVKYQAFGFQYETERQIMKSIGIDVLTGDKVPAALRARMANAVYQGGKKYGGEHRPMYALLFDQSVGGVSFTELAEHLPVRVMVRPFGAYVGRHSLVRTAVERPSEMPPPGLLAELGATPAIPMPRTVRLPVPMPDSAVASSDDPDIEVTLPSGGG